MKKVPTWALVVGGLGLAYLLAQNAGKLRRDAYQLGRNISERSGGRVPPPPRSWLPSVTPDPGFGVSFDLPDWLRAHDEPRVYAGGDPDFYRRHPPVELSVLIDPAKARSNPEFGVSFN